MTPAQSELNLLLARTRAGRLAATPRIRQLAAEVDYAALEDGLRRRRLLPLLGGRLVEIAGATVPDAFREAVLETRDRARVAGLVLQLQTEEAIRAFADASIEAMPLKGTWLAEAAHHDLGLRHSSDIDLLVGERDLPRAVEVLRAAGYRAPQDAVDRDGLPLLHFRLLHPERAPVELHWRIHWYERRFSADLLERRAPEDVAAALLLFYARDGFLGLRLAADLAGWWDRHGHEVPRGALAGHLRRYPELARSWLAAATMAEAVAAVPARVWFDGADRLDRRARFALRLGNWSETGGHSQLAANLMLLDGLLAPNGMLGAAVQREFHRAPAGRVEHVVKISARSVVGLARAFVSRWAPLPD